ncbi:stage II sporulation protein M [Faecalimicrobium dakarense]|uniref:stage II sporulation protein M n=1 Tax=Faecalimicrobium dakarense TaxID=1301100 RepID=UPI0004B3BC21|nr:stage II sporulation protein M [[Clostridium] dakarense]
MRKTYRKGNFREINEQIIVVGFIFVVFVILGSFLNKIWPVHQNNIMDNINPVIEYYNLSPGTKDAVISNLKNDFIFMSSISIFTLLVITFPIILIIFMLKGLSIGYTINSAILALKLKGSKMILIVLLKNLIIIPGAIILILISLNYLKEVIYELKKGKRDNILFLGKRYLLNAIIVLAITVSLQLILNTISIGIIKFLVR